MDSSRGHKIFDDEEDKEIIHGPNHLNQNSNPARILTPENLDAISKTITNNPNKKLILELNGAKKEVSFIERIGYFGEVHFDIVELVTSGKGDFGSVYKVLTSVKFDIKNELKEKPILINYLYKVFKKDNVIENIQKELAIVKAVPSLRAKNIVAIPAEKLSASGYHLCLFEFDCNFKDLDLSSYYGRQEPCLIKDKQGKYKLWGYKGNENEWQFTEINDKDIPIEWKQMNNWKQGIYVFVPTTADIFDTLKQGHNPITTTATANETIYGFAMLNAGEVTLKDIIKNKYADNGTNSSHPNAKTIYSPTPKQQIALILAILREVSDFHRLTRLVHADIKPDNIIVDASDENHPRVRLIDFGLSQIPNKPYMKEVEGAIGYQDPALFTLGVVNFRDGNDIFSTGRTIEHLFTGDELFKGVRREQIKEQRKQDIEDDIMIFPFYQENSLAENLIKSYPQHNKKIMDNIKKMLSNNEKKNRPVSKRPALTESIALYEEIYIDLVMEEAKKKVSSIKLSDELLKEELKKASNTAKEINDQLNKNTEANKLIQHKALNVMNENIVKGLKKLGENPHPVVLEHFLDRLGIRYLYNCESVQDIRTKLDELKRETLDQAIKLQKKIEDTNISNTDNKEVSLENTLHGIVLGNARRDALHKVTKLNTIDDHVELLGKLRRLNKKVTEECEMITKDPNLCMNKLLGYKIEEVYQMRIPNVSREEINKNDQLKKYLPQNFQQFSKQYYSAASVHRQAALANDPGKLRILVKEELAACRESRSWYQFFGKSRLEKQLDYMAEKLNIENSEINISHEKDSSKACRHDLLSYIYIRERSSDYKERKGERKMYQECFAYARDLADQIVGNPGKYYFNDDLLQNLKSKDSKLGDILTKYNVQMLLQHAMPTTDINPTHSPKNSSSQ